MFFKKKTNRHSMMHHAGLGFHTPGRRTAAPRGGTGIGTMTNLPARKPTQSTTQPTAAVLDSAEQDDKKRPSLRRRDDVTQETRCESLYMEMQIVCAQAKASLRVRADLIDGASETSSIPADTWLHLMYPMKEIENLSTRRVFMRCKTVDADTGQLHMSWVCILETDKDSGAITRHVGNFTLYPLTP
jgi:hypothetical protein